MSEHTGDMLDDEAEDRRDQWIFNAVVFFLLFPFTIGLSLMTSSPIPVGIGISLITWRVARTLEITRRLSLNMSGRLRRLLHSMAIALGASPILLGVIVYATSNPYVVSRGFPYSVTYVFQVALAQEARWNALPTTRRGSY